jgi:hypothetical protein
MNDSNEQNRATQRHQSLSRRRFLRGLGAAVALPAFESLMRGGSAMAASTTMPAAATSAATGAPLRMAFVYFPNGAIQPNWWPTGEGRHPLRGVDRPGGGYEDRASHALPIA